MKKYLVILAVLAVVCMGASTQIGRALRTDSFGWETMGTTLSTTKYTTPGVTERDYTNLVANHANSVVFTLSPYRWNVATFRFIVDADGNDTVYDVFASKGQDYFERVCTLTLKGGTASAPGTSTDSTSAVFCDTATISNEIWFSTLIGKNNAGADRQATITVDMQGYDTWAFVPTTAHDGTTMVQATGH